MYREWLITWSKVLDMGVMRRLLLTPRKPPPPPLAVPAPVAVPLLLLSLFADDDDEDGGGGGGGNIGSLLSLRTRFGPAPRSSQLVFNSPLVPSLPSLPSLPSPSSTAVWGGGSISVLPPPREGKTKPVPLFCPDAIFCPVSVFCPGKRVRSGERRAKEGVAREKGGGGGRKGDREGE